MTVKIDHGVFNPVYYPHLFTDTEYFICYGGSGSGKSFAITQKIIIDIMQGGRNYLVIRKVSRTIRNSVFALFQKIISEWNVNQLFTFNKSEYSITCVNGYKIICQGLDDPEKIKSITVSKGIITDVWIEEATELLETDLNQLILRLRGKTELKKRIILTFNPISETHWIKKRFYDNPAENVKILKTTYFDNLKYLSRDDIDKIESLKIIDPLYYQIYALGEWGQLNYNDTVFKLETVLKMLSNKPDQTGEIEVGADIARFGNDSTIFYKRKGLSVIEKMVIKKQDTIYTANKLKEFAGDKNTLIKIDDTGIGGGVTDNLTAEGYNVQAVNFGSVARNPNKYSNLISEMWFYCAGIAEKISIKEDKELKDELLSRKYFIDEKGRRRIERKDDFKKRFGRSPDSADAFLLCFWNVNQINIPDNLSFVGLREDPMEKFYR